MIRSYPRPICPYFTICMGRYINIQLYDMKHISGWVSKGYRYLVGTELEMFLLTAGATTSPAEGP